MRVEEAALPGWAWDILAAEERRYHLPVTRLDWRVDRKRRNFQTAGLAIPADHRIVISAGTDEQDQRVMLLHEIAHIIAAPDRGHDGRWRAISRRLYARYGLMDAAAQHEWFVELAASPEFRKVLLDYAQKPPEAHGRRRGA